MNTDLLEREFDEEFYLARNPDVASAGYPAIEHYRNYGWKEGRQPAPWFSADEYEMRFPGLVQRGIDPFVHFLEHGDVEAAKARYRVAGSVSNVHAVAASDPSSYRLYSLRPPSPEERKLAAPHFDASYYLGQNPDVAATLVDPLTHFLTVGWAEGRDPSPDFSVRHYLKANDDIREAGVNPFLHYLQYGRFEPRSVAGAAAAQVLEAFETDPDLVTAIAEARAIEPMVTLPRTPRSAILPPVDQRRMAEAARQLRESFARRSYRHVVLVPDIHMSRAARVSSIFTSVLAEVADAKDILVVATDMPDGEFAHWFDDGVGLFDLAANLEGLDRDHQAPLLYDLLRGLDAEAVFNLNSGLAWHAMQMFGRQLRQDFKVFTYLFTWDETPGGERVGYPIQWLRHSCDSHHVIFADSEMLARYVTERFAYNAVSGTEVVALHTPVPAPETDRASREGEEAPPRFLWAGPFDRQKRTDLLVRIAEANPDIEFDVYGEAVRDEPGLTAGTVPPNCALKGTYAHLRDVLATPYDGFVYTAQWDGIPTILLDMAQAGLPVVAPDVGAIHELVNNETGWLIERFDDVGAYGRALHEIISRPDLAAERAARLKSHVAARFSLAGYRDALRGVLKRHGL